MPDPETRSVKPDDVQLFSRCNFCGAYLDEDGHCPRERDYPAEHREHVEYRQQDPERTKQPCQ
jgi:hypothetical protein